MKNGWQIGPDTWRARNQRAKRDRYAELRRMGLTPVEAIKVMGMAGRGATPARYERWYQHQLAQREPATLAHLSWR
jgi:hypothetical protein